MSDLSNQVNMELNFGGVIADILMGAVRGQNKAGERLLGLSAIEAPFDTGDLVGAGQVVNADTVGESTQVVYDRPQAARLHEHPEYSFQNGRKGKYLEDPAMQNIEEFRQIIAKEAGGV